MQAVKYSDVAPNFRQSLTICLEDFGLVPNQETHVFLTITSRAEVEAANRRDEDIPAEAIRRLAWNSITYMEQYGKHYVTMPMETFMERGLLNLMTQEYREKFFDGK